VPKWCNFDGSLSGAERCGNSFYAISKEMRPALYIFHLLFNSYVLDDQRSKGWKEFNRRHSKYGELPVSEVIIARTLLESQVWSIKLHQKAYDAYWAERPTKSGCHAPRLFEAAMTLALAERYRECGDEPPTKRLIEKAVDDFPGNEALLRFEQEVDLSKPIFWREILLPRAKNAGE